MVSGQGQKDSWDSGAAYESYVGRWSRLVARQFVAWLDVRAGARWLDIGCGTGGLTEVILELAAPTSVLGIDPSPAFIAHASEQVRSSHVQFRVGDGQALPLAEAAFDVAVSGLILNFIPHPARAVAEMARVTRAGGTLAGYVWDYAGRMEMMRYFWDAAVALEAGARELDEGNRFAICRPERLKELFLAAGLHDVETRAIDIRTRFRDFDDYWSPFLGGQAPAPGYAMSLSQERRAALRERIKEAVPIAGDGSIDLIARAWAVRGRRR